MWYIYALFCVIIIAILFVGLIILFPREENESVFVARTKKEKRGNKGESDVSLYLYEIINIYGGYLFNDFCFKTENDSSTEIDHILITRGMVFVIETKNIFGYVRGHECDKYWHCITPGNYAHSALLFNPTWQNKGHVRQLTSLLTNKSVKITPMVIFPSANIMQLDSKEVFKIKTAISFIERAVRNDKKQILKTYKIAKDIKRIKKNYSISKKEHVKNMRRKFN